MENQARGVELKCNVAESMMKKQQPFGGTNNKQTWMINKR